MTLDTDVADKDFNIPRGAIKFFMYILAVFKGLIMIIPCALFICSSCTTIAIVLLGHDVVFTYQMLFKTRIIGINLKILGMCLLPIALILWPILIFFFSAIVGLFFGFYRPLRNAKLNDAEEDRDIFFSGTFDVLDEAAIDVVYYFSDLNYKSYFAYLDELRDRPVDTPFDIYFIELIIAVMLSVVGCIVHGLCIFLLTVIKLPAAICRVYILAYTSCFECVRSTPMLAVCFLPFAIVAFFGLFIVSILAACLVIVVGIFSGIYVGVQYYSGGFCNGPVKALEASRNVIVGFDKASNDYIFHSDSSVLELCCGKPN